jgi:hypothetical protein
VVMSNTATPGGGIWNGQGATTTVIRSAIHDNSVTGGSGGGGIFNDAQMTIISSCISYNNDSSTGGGGGIFNSGNMTISASTIDHNGTGTDGGGIKNYGALTITNSTLSGNHASGSGGGLYNAFIAGASVLLVNDTIYGNIVFDGLIPGPASDGGGLYNAGGSPVTLRQTILAGNSYMAVFNSFANDCRGTLTSLNYNFIGVLTVNCTQSGVIVNNKYGNPLLNPLANNGGPSTGAGQPPLTHLPLSNSPVVDAGEWLGCNVSVDERGVHRPIDGNRNGFAICDIGAVEYQLQAFVPVVSR